MNEKQYISDVVKRIYDADYNLEVRVIEAVAGPGLAMHNGDVMRLKTGAKLQTVGAASGASAVAVLLEEVTLAESLADCNKVCLVRGPAVIDSDKLVFTTSAVQKAAAVAALKVLLMIAANSALTTWTKQSS